jgi:hypothetical protein
VWLKMRNTQAVTAKVGKRAPDMRLLTIPEVRALGPEARYRALSTRWSADCWESK